MAGTRNTRSGQSRITSFVALFAVFCILFSTAQAASAVLGVDFGTEYIKATLVKPGIPLDIVLTKDTRRKEISAVCFKPVQDAEFPERLYGSDAMALSARFPGEVFPNLKSLLGLPYSNTKVQDYASMHPAIQLVEEKVRGTVAIKSGCFDADQEPFAVEELLAMELQSIQKNAEILAGKGTVIKDIVITVPPFFGQEEKRAIKLAANLAGMRVLSLISDGLAVGLNYATTRTFPSVNEGGKAEHHLIFDMGAGSTKTTVLQFQGRVVKDVGKFNKTVQEVSVLGTGWDRTLGGDALNAIIVEDMVNSFIESKAAKAASIEAGSVKAHGRAMAKLTKEAERIRTVLSANTETQQSFEGFYEDINFRYKITRAHFEKLAEAFAEKVHPAIESAVSMANLQITDLDSVIVHGGAVRTPFIQKQLEKIFGSAEKIRSSVNSDESAVFGAGFKGAALSPSFRVKEIRASEVAGYRIGMNWTNIHGKPQHQSLFTPQSSLGKEKTLSFQNQKDFSIDFHQHMPDMENVSPGSAEKGIISITTKNLTTGVTELKGKGCAESDILTKVGVQLSVEDGEVQFTKLALHCELEEEEKKDSMVDSVKGLFGFGKDKSQQVLSDDSEQVETTSSSQTSAETGSSATAKASGKNNEEKSKPTKRTIIIPVEYETTTRGYPQLPAAEVSRMKQRIQAFEDSDRSRVLREEALNQLEAYTYRVRDWIEDTTFVAASTVAERTKLESLAKAAGEWIYGEGATATREQLKSKLKELKEIVTPIDIRRSESSSRPASIKALQEALNQTKTFIETIQEQIKAQADIAASSASSLVLGEDTETTTAESADSTTTVGDFDDLEDETTSTTSSSKSSFTPPPPPPYAESDLTPVQELYDSVSSWLTEKLAEQDALPETADPIVLAKDLTSKAEQLNKAGMDLIMKAMRQIPPTKSSSSKSKTSKTRKPKKTKAAKPSKDTDAKEDPETGVKKGKIGLNEDEEIDLPEGMKMFRVGENGEMPSEEEILEALGDKAPTGDQHDEL